MLGKIINYYTIKNQVFIVFETKKIIATIIDDGICNFKEEETSSFAVDVNGFIFDYINPVVEKIDNAIKITHGRYKYVINDNFILSIYFDDVLISSDISYYNNKTNEFIDNSLLEAEGHAVNIEEEYKYIISKKINSNDCLYGLGDKTGFLNKRGYEYDMWNTDDPAPHVDSFKALYKSIPFFIVFNKSYSYGYFFDNTYKSNFNMAKNNSEVVSIGFTDGPLNYYFIGGNNLKDVVSNYTYITGRMDMPKRFTLGYHQSRWSYSTKDEVIKLVDNFKKYDIPLECVHLDIDYMDGYRVFTVNDERFSDFKNFTEEMKNKGVKLVTIIDPGVKVDSNYDVYNYIVKNKLVATENNEVYVNSVWPGESVYPSFIDPKLRTYWGELDGKMLDLGVSGIWNDMNEPASFNGPLPSKVEFFDGNRIHYHDEVHNIYGHYMAKATYEGMKKHNNERPFVITRACYAGTQKYSTVWTGDNHSIWSHLQMAIPQICNLGLSGFAFAGCDVGGFSSDATKELLIRWAELGAITPLFRNHSAMGTKRQEPWEFDDETISIYRKAVKLRYEIIPYYYDLFFEAANTGIPAFRAVVLEYPEDSNTYEINDEVMLGANILASPVVEQGKRNKLVYLPSGTNWYDYYSYDKFEPGYHIYDAPLDKLPLFVKEGAIIPKYPNYESLDDPKTIIFEIYPGDGTYIHYQDNGVDFNYEEGEYNIYEISHIDGNIRIDLSYNGYKLYDKIYIKYKNNIQEYKEIGTILKIE